MDWVVFGITSGVIIVVVGFIYALTSFEGITTAFLSLILGILSVLVFPTNKVIEILNVDPYFFTPAAIGFGSTLITMAFFGFLRESTEKEYPFAIVIIFMVITTICASLIGGLLSFSNVFWMIVINLLFVVNVIAVWFLTKNILMTLSSSVSIGSFILVAVLNTNIIINSILVIPLALGIIVHKKQNPSPFPTPEYCLSHPEDILCRYTPKK